MSEPKMHKPWPRPWTWALVLAVLLFGAHATIRWWGTALVRVLFGDITALADAPPLIWGLMVGWVILSIAGGSAIGLLIVEGSSVWDRPCWRHEQAERERQRALQRQLRELEQQIREEAMSEEEREWHRQYRERQAEIRREALRRLGLPEEEADG